MLDTLHRIVSAVNRSTDLQRALLLIVKQVKVAIGSDVCSIYLSEEDTKVNVLMATDGFRKEAVGKVRLPYGRGLVGLVAERAEPINLDDAMKHPRYMHISETGETQYHGFLGVPIIQNRRVLGVLVVRQEKVRQFQDEEVTFLFTLAAQLAGAITHAKASGELSALNPG
jgi:phosphotransferase system enzyme I (PtsP)